MFSIYIIILYGVLVALKPTRKVALALMPWLVFACSYDWMRLLPNYEVNPIDVRGLYEAERGLFGIAAASGGHLIPCEYFAAHHCAVADVLAGQGGKTSGTGFEWIEHKRHPRGCGCELCGSEEVQD